MGPREADISRNGWYWMRLGQGLSPAKTGCAPDSGQARVSRASCRLSYLIQGLSVSFRQILGLVVCHGPFTHHLGAEEISGF